MTVSGRLDDTDVVHVLSQVLVLQGQPGGPRLLEQRPDVLSVILTPATGGTLLASQEYDYRITNLNADGGESLASLPTASIFAPTGGAVHLDNLPIAPIEFVGRRLYRSVPGTTDYEFVTQLDRSSTSYNDDGTTRGGLLRSEQHPATSAVTLSDSFGNLPESVAFDYRLTFVDIYEGETQASDPTTMRVVSSLGGIQLNNLPVAPADFVAKRIYRLDPGTGDYQLVVELDSDVTSYVDDGRQLGGLLQNGGNNGALLLPRYDARLSVDPGIITKLQNARIQAGFGADFYAEGVDGKEVVFTSRLDDTFGAGGTFDTNNDGISNNASAGDWGGLVFRQDATGSLNFADVRFGGGSTPTQGSFTEFNAIEILQADVRITNSTIHDNASGFVTSSNREGIGFNDAAAIFVRGAQPIILNNIIEANDGAAISINPDAMDFHDRLDVGRSAGPIDLIATDRDNQGPLIGGNRIDGNVINGMRVRSELLTTESVWDDTDIVHVVEGQIISATHHFKSGLRLKSDPEQGLVVKFGQGAELVGTGIPLDIDDRIGGSLQVIGTPGNPVILTALADNTVGAGFTPSGTPQVNTVPGSGGNGLLPTGPEVNNGLTIDNDVPQAIPGSFEVTPSAGGDLNFTDRVTVDSMRAF